MDNLIDFTLYRCLIPVAIGSLIGYVLGRRNIRDRIKSILEQIAAGNGPL